MYKRLNGAAMRSGRLGIKSFWKGPREGGGRQSEYYNRRCYLFSSWCTHFVWNTVERVVHHKNTHIVAPKSDSTYLYNVPTNIFLTTLKLPKIWVTRCWGNCVCYCCTNYINIFLLLFQVIGNMNKQFIFI